MKHSNRREMEKKYHEELQYKRAEKRDRYLVKDRDEDYYDEPRKKKKRSTCCMPFFVIFIIFSALLFYVYWQVKDTVKDEWDKRMAQIEDLQQQVESESDDLFSQGEEMLDKVEDTTEKVSTLKKALLDAKVAFENLTKKNDPGKSETEVIEEERVVQEEQSYESKYPVDYVPYWLYQMRENEDVYKVPDFRCEYFDETIYLALGGDDCQDCLQDYIYKPNGDYYCAASGGINGDGDGKCPGLLPYIEQCFIWNGEKWEKTSL